MDKFVAIRYIDALYYTDEKLKYTEFPVHIAVGKIISSNNSITLCFTEKDGFSEEGIVLPKGALVLQPKHEVVIPGIENLEIDNDIGIYWKDIAHFINGKIPVECTPMYTEGKLFSITHDAIIVKDPETLMTGKKVDNHPEMKTTFVVIPKSFITNLESYDAEI